MSEFSLKPIVPARPAIIPHLAAIASVAVFALGTSLAALIWGSL